MALQEDALCVYANEDVHPMEEAFISYGPELSSDDLVVFYGFLLPENPHDKAWVRMLTRRSTEFLSIFSNTNSDKKQWCFWAASCVVAWYANGERRTVG